MNKSNYTNHYHQILSSTDNKDVITHDDINVDHPYGRYTLWGKNSLGQFTSPKLFDIINLYQNFIEKPLVLNKPVINPFNREEININLQNRIKDYYDIYNKFISKEILINEIENFLPDIKSKIENYDNIEDFYSWDNLLEKLFNVFLNFFSYKESDYLFFNFNNNLKKIYNDQNGHLILKMIFKPEYFIKIHAENFSRIYANNYLNEIKKIKNDNYCIIRSSSLITNNNDLNNHPFAISFYDKINEKITNGAYSYRLGNGIVTYSNLSRFSNVSEISDCKIINHISNFFIDYLFYLEECQYKIIINKIIE